MALLPFCWRIWKILLYLQLKETHSRLVKVYSPQPSNKTSSLLCGPFLTVTKIQTNSTSLYLFYLLICNPVTLSLWLVSLRLTTLLSKSRFVLVYLSVTSAYRKIYFSLFFARVGKFSHVGAGKSSSVNFSDRVVGRYVTLTLPGSKRILTLCEVEVYGYYAPTGENQIYYMYKHIVDAVTRATNLNG